MLRLARWLVRRHLLFAMIPPFFLDCVCAIGLSFSQPGQPTQTRWIASGFLFGEPVPGLKDQYAVFLVTCNHVIEDLTDAVKTTAASSGAGVSVTPLMRFNPTPGGVAHDYPLSLEGWTRNQATDVAVTSMNVAFLKQQGISNLAFFPQDRSAANRSKVKDLGLSEGDGVYVLGFPLGLVEPGQHSFVIVRGGVIARIRDALAEKRDSFLIDSFAFPGNSGGPVISRPEAFAITGTKSQNGSYLLGMVRAELSYQEIAIGEQTKRPRVVFEENSGLAEVIPIDDVEDEIETAMAFGKTSTATVTPTPAR